MRGTQRWLVCNVYTALMYIQLCTFDDSLVQLYVTKSITLPRERLFVRLSTFWKEFSHIIYLIAQDWVAFSRLWIESVYQTALHHIIDIIDIASSLQDGDQR